MSRYFTATVLENIVLNAGHNLLALSMPDGTANPLPGQFYMIEVNRGNDPLLKRTFSFFRPTAGGFQLLYRIKGRGTALLREMKEGGAIEVLGPLGTSYPAPGAGQVPLVIAGGIGVASVFPFLLEQRDKAVLFYGARSRDEILMLDELKGICKEVYISTDDGSFGTKGNLVEMLDRN